MEVRQPQAARDLVARLARYQDGVFTRAQALQAGLSDDAQWRMVQRGDWVAVHAGVYASAGTPRTLAFREGAALLAAGPEAVLAGFNAAHHWGLWRKPPLVEILVPRWGGPDPDGVVVHTTRQMLEGDVVEDGWRRVVSPVRLTLELAARLPPRQLRMVVDDGVRLGLFCASDVYWRAMRANGRKKMKLLRHLAATVPESTTEHASRLENEFLRICQDHVIPRPECHRMVMTPAGSYEADFAWPDLGLVVEVDGPHHNRSEQRSFDRCRDADMADVDYDVLRVTLYDILHRPDHVGRRISQEFDRRRAMRSRVRVPGTFRG